MVMTAALEEGYHGLWLGLLFASAGVFHHAGIKIPFFAFFAHDAGIRTTEPPRNMLIAMGIAAALCIFNGSYPWVLYSLLPFEVDYTPYDATHVLAQMQLLFFSALAFTWLKLTGLYPPELRSLNIDAEWSYRKLMPAVVRGILAIGSPADRGIRTGFLNRVREVTGGTARLYGPDSLLARAWSTGVMVLWVAGLLGLYLLYHYL
jgi:multicomponent Na+:H+ antiporter subunit D